jgi:hypothetical protein
MDKGCALVRRHPDHPSYRRPGLPKLTVFHIPSFVDATGWTVRELPRRAGYELQRVIWHQKADSDRIERLMRGEVIAHPDEPTMSSATATIDADFWTSRYEALRVIEIPLIPERPMGLDGESFGLRVSGHIDIEWWGDGPLQWATLNRWTLDAISYFRTIIP